jgi:hypothetical protein
MITYHLIRRHDIPRVVQSIYNRGLMLGGGRRIFNGYKPGDYAVIDSLSVSRVGRRTIGWAAVVSGRIIRDYVWTPPNETMLWVYVDGKYRRRGVGTGMVGLLDLSRPGIRTQQVMAGQREFFSPFNVAA